MFKTHFAIAVALLALTACSFDEGYTPEPEGDSLQNRLGLREELVLEPTSLVGVAASDMEGNPLPCLQPSIAGGSSVMRSTRNDLLLIEDLEIDLTDVRVEPGVVYSEPIDLTGIQLRLGTQIVVEADWSADGTRAEGTGTADLLMDWAVLSDGKVLPLATQRIRDAEFAVVVTLEADGTISANVTTAVEGRIGSFANRIELNDFSMAVRATTP